MRTIRLPNVETGAGVQRFATPRALVSVGLLWLTLCFILPVVYLLVESLNFGDGAMFEHYARVFSTENPIYLIILGRTLWYALLVTVITLTLGYVMAYVIAFRAKRPIMWLAFVLLPLWVAIIIRFYGVQLFFVPTGPVQQVFDTDFNLYRSQYGVFLGLVSALLPFAVLPIYNSLRSIDEEVIDAASILGATPFQRLRTVVFPLSLSGVIAATLFVYILAAGSYLAPSMLGGPANTMMALQIVEVRSNSLPMAAALSVVFTVVLMVLIGLFNYFTNISEVLGEI